MTLRCWFMDGTNPHHPDPQWYTEHGKALCAPCERFYATQKAKRHHPTARPVLKLTKPDMTRCLAHDRDDRYSCPECQDFSEVFLND